METAIGQRQRIRLAGAIAVSAAMVVLYLFPPTQFSFYPRCLFKSFTGFDCAGCGSLRSVHELLHGNFSAAFNLNPLLITSLPVVAIFLINRSIRGKNLLREYEGSFWILVAVAVIFGVARNWVGIL